MITKPATTAFPWPTIEFKLSVATIYVAKCREMKVGYRMGAKVPRHGAAPGRDFTAVDCSGLVRELLWLASAGKVEIGDGSYNQHEAIKRVGFKVSAVQSGKLKDDTLRVAVMTAADGGGTGHIALIHNGLTLESHGGVGPDRRPWTGEGWQAKAHVYVLAVGVRG